MEFEEAKGKFEGLINELRKKFPEVDLNTPEGYREACRQYAEIVRPGIEAVERERRRSLGVAYRIIVR